MHDRPQTTSFRRRNLPHWRVAGRPYFVTFRLKGSLPKAVSASLREEYEDLLDRDQTEEEQLIGEKYLRRWGILSGADSAVVD